MVTEPIISNGGDAVTLQLVPCAKHKKHLCENGDKDSNPKTETLSVNGVRTYKRRKHSQSSSEDTLEHGRVSLEAGSQIMEKNSIKEPRGNMSDGSCNKPNNQANPHENTELCQRIFNEVIISEKCDLLCKLLSENFQGIKLESFSEFNIISSKIKDGVYGHSPQLFAEDIQQLWLMLQKIGIEMVSLTKGLSDMSRKFYHEQVGGSVNGDCVEGKHEEINKFHPGNTDCSGLDTTRQHPSQEADRHSKPYQAESDKICVCRYCGGKTDDRICIVCDSCEKMYHVFCVGVSVGEDSPRSWYCMNCVGSGLGSPHENCVVCERVNDPSAETHVGDGKMDAITHGMHCCNADEKSNGCMEANVILQSSKSTSSHSCKLCKCQFEDAMYRECEHYLCRNKFHLRCLSHLELKRFGPRWYCPSCICRVCLVDRDDEKIVLCDGCDNAYHVYCMEPPCTCIPTGEWFCKLCETRLKAIRKAKRVYENHHQKKSDAGVNTTVGSAGIPSSANRLYPNHKEDQKKDMSGKVKTVVGSMDMLLSAAETLKNEEKMIQ